MSGFHKLEVAEVKNETAECISIALRVPESLRETFQYAHGQYLTLNVTVGGEELRRAYSLCSSPLEQDLRIAVKRVEGGRVSTHLVQNLKAGDQLDVMAPMGGFTVPLDSSNSKQYVLFAAGSGITPMHSILKTVLHEEPKSKVLLIYANSNSQSVIFKDELEKLVSENAERFSVKHVLSREETSDPLFNGRIGQEKAGLLVERFVEGAQDKEFFICGPYDMMMNIKSALEAKGMSSDSIHMELFSTPVEEKGQAPAADDAPFDGTAMVKVIIDGDEAEIEIDGDGDSILDMALEHGMDAPFACKGAVCCTCKAKVTEGKVHMDMNYALTDGEVEDGYVLTCQCHPRSARVVVDFDQP